VPQVLTYVNTAQAVKRPSAGIGAGAFASLGAELAISGGHEHGLYQQGRYSGAGCANWLSGPGVDARTSTSTTNSTTKQFDQMTRIVPVIPGGLGPHTAREHKPV
jgi:hypothetical protein